MSQPIFLSIDQVMQILLGEMPDGVYATDLADSDNLDQRSYSSSEIRAHAKIYADLYANLQDIYENKFLSTVQPDGISRWEQDLFFQAVDSSAPFETRQQNAITKYRARGGISYAYMNTLIHSVLDPLGLSFDLVTFCGMNAGAWILDMTELDVGTYLATEDPLLGARQDLSPLDCSLDYAAAGLTAQDLLDIQSTAYTYQVRIYGNASGETLSKLDQVLTQNEKGGSTHEIFNNFPLPPDPDLIDMGQFTGDTLVDAIDCGIFLMPGATYDVWDFGGF